MRISLLQDSSSQPGEILAHVEVSALDDSPVFIYSHSFRYNVFSGKDGEIIIYTDRIFASGNLDGTRYSFALEKCRNKDCRKEYQGGCPVIAGKGNRLLVASVFHTQPTQDALRFFGAALFKALFSGYAEQLFQKLMPTHANGRILLQLNDYDDLEAIPWEYAKNHPTSFLVHQRKFARICERPQLPLPKFPLRIVAVVPNPIIPHDDTYANLEDLHLGDQWQKFIDIHYANSKMVILERVFPPTVDRMDELLMNESETTTALHFMGHCISKNNARVLMFEHPATGKYQFVEAERLNIPKHLRLAFLCACDTRDIARILLERSVPYTIGSHGPIPNNLARKFESEFYKFLAGGLSVEEAIWRARVFFQNQDDVRQSDYFTGVMVLYLSLTTEDSGVFECEKGVPTIKLHMPPNNFELIPRTPTFFGRKKELVELNSILRDMVDNNKKTCRVYTIVGIGGQGKTALAMEAVNRAAHLFPGGIFAWPFKRKPISLVEYIEQLVKVIFSKEEKLKSRNWDSSDDFGELGLAVIKKFAKHPSCLLVLDHADTLKFAEARGENGATALVAWLKELTSTRNIAVKILATSCESLGWWKEKSVTLNGFSNQDVYSGCKLFIENLDTKVRERIKKEENNKSLLRELVTRVDGHPLTLECFSNAIGLPEYLDKSLKDIVCEHYDTMLAKDDLTTQRLEHCFGPMINSLSTEQRLILHLCCLYTGPITLGVLSFVSHFVDRFETSAEYTDDFSSENIEAQLNSLCNRGLLKSTGENSYCIHIALRETLRQRNINLRLCLHLQVPGRDDDAFIIGVKTSLTLSKLVFKFSGFRYSLFIGQGAKGLTLTHCTAFTSYKENPPCWSGYSMT